jgi:hypothetical protein
MVWEEEAHGKRNNRMTKKRRKTIMCKTIKNVCRRRMERMERR